MIQILHSVRFRTFCTFYMDLKGKLITWNFKLKRGGGCA